MYLRFVLLIFLFSYYNFILGLGVFAQSPPKGMVEAPVFLPIPMLEIQINRQFQDLIYAEDDIPAEGYGTVDCKVWKTDSIQLAGVENTNQLLVNVPLKIWLKGDMKSNLLGISVEYPLDEYLFLKLTLQIDLTLQSDWRLKTKTILKEYQWLAKPSVKVGWVKIPIAPIADQVIEERQAEICRQFDAQISKYVSLREPMSEAWAMLQTPQAISEWQKEQVWLHIQPEVPSLTPLLIVNNQIKTHIALPLSAESSISTTFKISNPEAFPDFLQALKGEEQFYLPVSGSIDRKLAIQKAKAIFASETYNFNGKKAQIRDLDIGAEGDKILIELRLAGDVTGKFFLKGKPVWNKKERRLMIQDLDYTIDKGADMGISGFVRWLFNGKIKRKLKEAIEEPINAEIKQMRSDLEKTLESYALAPNVIIKGKLADFALSDIRITDTHIRSQVDLRGSFAVFLNGF
jgi:hypothetical protein